MRISETGVSEFILSAAADFKEGKSYFNDQDYELAIIKLKQSINKLAENDGDFSFSEEHTVFGSLHRIVEYVDIKVSKCFALRQKVGFIFDVLTNSAPLHDERWPLFAYLMALYQENLVKGMETAHHTQYIAAHVEGMEVALLADALFWLGSCYYSINQFSSAKAALSGALRLYLITYGERSYKYASTLTSLEALPVGASASVDEARAMRTELARLWPRVFALAKVD